MYRENIKKYLSLYLVIDRRSCGDKDIFFVLEQAIRGGVTIVQLREKDIDAREFVSLAKKVKSFLTRFQIPLIVNDRVDIALAAGADGVHVGQEDMHPLDVRKIAGNDLIVGLSVNTKEHAMEANRLDIDYVGIGPVYPTSTKKDPKPTLYLKGLKNIVSVLNKPCVGIGGITEKNCKEAILAGIDGVAVVSAICSDKEPYLAAKNLARCVKNALKNRVQGPCTG